MTSNYDTEHRTSAGRQISRYDLILAVIPAAFLLAFVASQVVPVSTRVLLTGATTVGALALVDGLFVNPPSSGSGAA